MGHGSLAVDPVIETRLLENRLDDDNPSRHAGVFAICDWLLGGDMQWLRSLDEDNAYYSHDHGFFLTGPDWTVDTLTARQNEPAPVSTTTASFGRQEIERLADSLESLTRDDIDGAMSALPASWPVTDEELAHAATVIDYRRAPVAGRLRALVS
jgi:hypothetical protein